MVLAHDGNGVKASSSSPGGDGRELYQQLVARDADAKNMRKKYAQVVASHQAGSLELCNPNFH